MHWHFLYKLGWHFQCSFKLVKYFLVVIFLMFTLGGLLHKKLLVKLFLQNFGARKMRRS